MRKLDTATKDDLEISRRCVTPCPSANGPLRRGIVESNNCLRLTSTWTQKPPQTRWGCVSVEVSGYVRVLYYRGQEHNVSPQSKTVSCNRALPALSQEPGQRLTERQGLCWTYRRDSGVKQLMRLEILWLTDGGLALATVSREDRVRVCE